MKGKLREFRINASLAFFFESDKKGIDPLFLLVEFFLWEYYLRPIRVFYVLNIHRNHTESTQKPLT